RVQAVWVREEGLLVSARRGTWASTSCVTAFGAGLSTCPASASTRQRSGYLAEPARVFLSSGRKGRGRRELEVRGGRRRTWRRRRTWFRGELAGAASWRPVRPSRPGRSSSFPSSSSSQSWRCVGAGR
ncbi:hypothetical protein T484DRAFT_1885466, partial [Baffinella frigidus]